MSLVPASEVGLWNAWILILPLVVLSALVTKILVTRGSGEDPGLTDREKIVFAMHHLLFLVSCAYTIFLPLKLGTIWFYAGLLSYSLGTLITFSGLLSFCATPMDKPVTKGVYSISRNPMYEGSLSTNVGISMACLSWIFLLVTAAAVILEYDLLSTEERTCLKQYGDAYREYVKRTPRWLLFKPTETATAEKSANFH